MNANFWDNKSFHEADFEAILRWISRNVSVSVVTCLFPVFVAFSRCGCVSRTSMERYQSEYEVGSGKIPSDGGVGLWLKLPHCIYCIYDRVKST